MFGDGDALAVLGSGRNVTGGVGVGGGDFAVDFLIFCLGGKAGGTTELLLDEEDRVVFGECKGEGPLKQQKSVKVITITTKVITCQDWNVKVSTMLALVYF